MDFIKRNAQAANAGTGNEDRRPAHLRFDKKTAIVGFAAPRRQRCPLAH
jgi:hypothetical protein